MSSTIRPDAGEQSPVDGLTAPRGRRDFLKWTGAGAAAVVLSACSDEDTRTLVEVLPPDTVEVEPPPPTFDAVTLNFANDFGVLNYAYALEQLEAAFYTQVVAAAGFTSTFSEEEQRILVDLKDHEVIHREFFRAAIPNANRIPGLTPNFSAVNFQSRLSVLNTAQTFEDLGVAAYNGAARYFSNTDAGRSFVTVAGKIVSVEARHAAAIRDRLNPRSGAFAPQAFDPALAPSDVLGAAAPFIRNQITLSNVPA